MFGKCRNQYTCVRCTASTRRSSTTRYRNVANYEAELKAKRFSNKFPNFNHKRWHRLANPLRILRSKNTLSLVMSFYFSNINKSKYSSTQRSPMCTDTETTVTVLCFNAIDFVWVPTIPKPRSAFYELSRLCGCLVQTGQLLFSFIFHFFFFCSLFTSKTRPSIVSDYKMYGKGEDQRLRKDSKGFVHVEGATNGTSHSFKFDSLVPELCTKRTFSFDFKVVHFFFLSFSPLALLPISNTFSSVRHVRGSTHVHI